MLVILLIIIFGCLAFPWIYTWWDSRDSNYGWDWELVGAGYLWALIPLAVALVAMVPLVDVNYGEKTYTGYIYSSEDILGRTVGHIRFSENAGADEQPSFCAVKDTEQAKKIKELTGSGKKVKVTEPAGFGVQMWYGQCNLPVTVEELE